MKVDRLRWEAGIAFDAYGSRLGIRVNSEAALELLTDYLPPGWKRMKSPVVDHLWSAILGGTPTRRGVRRYNLLYNGSSRIVRSLDEEEVWQELISSMDALVARGSAKQVFVHAGVVAWGDEAILIPGRSHSGKSRLVKALVEAGATYFSDEFAVLDGKGRVRPYPRPLKIRQDEGRKGILVPVEDIGGEVGQGSLKVGGIVDTSYEAGTNWRPKPLSRGDAFLRLWDNTVIARLRPGQALPILRLVAMRARAVRGKRGDAKETADQLLSMIERNATRPVLSSRRLR